MKPSPHQLFLERLEDRTIPSASPWLNPGKLTLSFVPDGTSVGSGMTSDLTAMLGASATSAWEGEILRAFQTWAVAANINIAVVPDGGQPLGTPGLPQGDPRFGDIRIAAAPLGDPALAGLAQTVTATGTGSTWAGDMIINSDAPVGIGSQYNLFSVALHEAGHSFGFPDETTDPTSVEYTTYQPATGLGPADVAAVQAVYGAPTGDPFGGGVTNTTPATAFDLSRRGNLTDIAADIAQVGGTEVFMLTTPTAKANITGLTVNVRAAGISLFTPQVTVLDASGNTITSAAAAGPLSNTVSVTLPNYNPSTTYYIQVQGANAGVFSAGAYALQLSYSRPYGNSFNLGSTYLNAGLGQNLTFASAQTLGFSGSTQATDFTAVGTLFNPASTNWYRITPRSATSFTGTLTVGVVGLDANGLLPIITVYNSLGQPLAAAVVANESGTFTVQLAGQQTSTTYYVGVSAADPAGDNATGRYALWSDLSQIAPTVFTALTSATLTADTSATYSQLTISDTRLIQFSLSATADTSGVVAAVRVTIFDANGNTVFTTVAEAGDPLVTGTVWLPAGTYTVVFNAGTTAGAVLPGLTYLFSELDLSDPVDPYPVDPTNPSPPTSPPPPPPPPVVVVVSPPAPLPTTTSSLANGLVIGTILSPVLSC